MIILDTGVLSELMRPTPSEAVLRWFSTQTGTSLFTTTITQAEIMAALIALPSGSRRDDLLAAAEQMFEEDFANRVLSFDAAAARAHAMLAAGRRRAGRPAGGSETLIAAIALSRSAALATRNMADFQDFRLPLVNPWNS
jgi:predicted nucleic acid-binding protein